MSKSVASELRDLIIQLAENSDIFTSVEVSEILKFDLIKINKMLHSMYAREEIERVKKINIGNFVYKINQNNLIFEIKSNKYSGKRIKKELYNINDIKHSNKVRLINRFLYD